MAVTELKHERLQAGDKCPECSRGKVYPLKPGILIRLTSQPLVSGQKYVIEKLRCNMCTKLYTAGVPPNIVNAPKYDTSCRSMLALSRYAMGLPFHRIERIQGLLGIPLADATQWDLVSELAKDVKPVFETLKKKASEGSLFLYDDTPMRILRDTLESDRKGRQTTVITAKQERIKMVLFFTSERHAGENFEALLKERLCEDPFISMSDAAAKNFPCYLPAELWAKWVISTCLVHGRRKFYELKDLFPVESEFILDCFGKVYFHEKQTLDMTPEQRLEHHRTYSKPLLHSLKGWMEHKLIHREVEPNSSLGKSMLYMLKNWREMTKFCEVAGVPLDNNYSERLLKTAIRHRKNSLFYLTSRGALVGDILMSLIQTCAENGVNPYQYLIALQENKAAVAVSPEEWLPWNYEHNLQKAA